MGDLGTGVAEGVVGETQVEQFQKTQAHFMYKLIEFFKKRTILYYRIRWNYILPSDLMWFCHHFYIVFQFCTFLSGTILYCYYPDWTENSVLFTLFKKSFIMGTLLPNHDKGCVVMYTVTLWLFGRCGSWKIQEENRFCVSLQQNTSNELRSLLRRPCT